MENILEVYSFLKLDYQTDWSNSLIYASDTVRSFSNHYGICCTHMRTDKEKPRNVWIMYRVSPNIEEARKLLSGQIEAFRASHSFGIVLAPHNVGIEKSPVKITLSETLQIV